MSLQQRVESLEEIYEAVDRYDKSIANPALFIKEMILENDDLIEAGNILTSLEIHDETFKILKVRSERKDNRKQKGKLVRNVCEEILDMMAGYNIENDFSSEEIDQLELMFSESVDFLKRRRPAKVYQIVKNASPNALITQELIDDIIEELEKLSN